MLVEDTDEGGGGGLTYGPVDEAEEKREEDEGGVPLVARLVQRRGSQEDKDDGLAHAAQHLQEVLDGRVGLLGDVLLHVWLHEHCTEYNPINTE